MIVLIDHVEGALPKAIPTKLHILVTWVDISMISTTVNRAITVAEIPVHVIVLAATRRARTTAVNIHFLLVHLVN